MITSERRTRFAYHFHIWLISIFHLEFSFSENVSLALPCFLSSELLILATGIFTGFFSLRSHYTTFSILIKSNAFYHWIWTEAAALQNVMPTEDVLVCVNIYCSRVMSVALVAVCFCHCLATRSNGIEWEKERAKEKCRIFCSNLFAWAPPTTWG